MKICFTYYKVTGKLYTTGEIDADEIAPRKYPPNAAGAPHPADLMEWVKQKRFDDSRLPGLSTSGRGFVVIVEPEDGTPILVHPSDDDAIDDFADCARRFR